MHPCEVNAKRTRTNKTTAGFSLLICYTLPPGCLRENVAKLPANWYITLAAKRQGRQHGLNLSDIRVPGIWESLEMVQRYTRSVTFEDSMNHYKAPLSEAT